MSFPSPETSLSQQEGCKRVPFANTLKIIAIFVVFLLLSVSWGGTIPSGEAEEGDPVAVIGLFREVPVESEVFLANLEWTAPYFTDIDEDGYVDILFYQLGSVYLHAAIYDSTDDVYFQTSLLDISQILGGDSGTSGSPSRAVTSVMANLNNDPEGDDIVITVDGELTLYRNIGDGEGGLPEFEKHLEDVLPPDTEIYNPTFANLVNLNDGDENDNDLDMICMDDSSTLVYYKSNFYDDGSLTFENCGSVTDENGNSIPNIHRFSPRV